jgi:hypothetical protein
VFEILVFPLSRTLLFSRIFTIQFYCSAVEEKPSSAGSKKTPADGVKTPDPDLVEVKAGSYTKK